MAQFKLNYFNLRARGELVRFIFAAAGQEFTDNRIEFPDWPALKPNAPFGQLPYLEITEDGKTVAMCQSMAIARYVARRFGLAGKNDLEIGFTDMYAEQVHDVINELIKAHFEKEEARKAELVQRLHTEVVPNSLKIFEKQLAANNGHLSGSGLTYADLYLYVVLEFLGDKKTAALEHFPHVKKLDETIRNHEKIAAYLSKRPVTAV